MPCQRLSVLPIHVIQAVANQVHDAGLDHGLRKHRLYGLGKTAQAINHANQNILCAACLEIVEHFEPELSTLGLLNPQPQHILATAGIHPKRQLHRLVLDRPLVANLQAQRVKENHRVHGLQRPGLPLLCLGHDLIRDGRYQRG